MPVSKLPTQKSLYGFLLLCCKLCYANFIWRRKWIHNNRVMLRIRKETPAATQARTQLCQAFLIAWLWFWVFLELHVKDEKRTKIQIIQLGSWNWMQKPDCIKIRVVRIKLGQQRKRRKKQNHYQKLKQMRCTSL